MAEGTYIPTTDETGDTSPEYPRMMSIVLKSGVEVYGGFDGTETELTQRDISSNTTILSGDMNGDDGASFANNSENVYHVVSGADNAVLDGFTIIGGNATGGPGTNTYFGGGVFNNSASPSISNCVITENSAVYGAGAYGAGGSPSFDGCVLSANESPGSGLGDVL